MQLVKAENKYVGEQHRQRTLYASIETSVRYLDEDHRHLLSGLWLFHAPFLPETAVEIFDPQAENADEGMENEGQRSPIYDRLHTLWRRSLLNRETITVREGTWLFYRLPPTMRPYIEQYLAPSAERASLLARFGAAYDQLVRFLYRELDRGGIAAALALLLREDIEQGASYVTGVEQGYYWLRWGWILQRLGFRTSGLELTEQALQVGQEQDQRLKLEALNNMAEVYRQTGQPQQSLRLYEQALPLMREVGDRAGEATTLNNMALVYQQTGQPQQALKLYEQALPLRREMGNRAGEATTLNGLAYLYQDLNRYTEAEKAFEQSIVLEQQTSHRDGEIAGLFGLSLLLYQHLDRPQEAITRMEQALAVLVETGLPQDAAGHTKEQLQQYLNAMRQGVKFGQATNAPATMPDAQVQQVITNTIAVMTVAQDHRAEWRENIQEVLQQAQQRGIKRDIDFFSTLLDILDGKSPTLPDDHPYAQAIASIQEGIDAGGPKIASIPDETIESVSEFVNAENWEAKRHFVETQQALLFQPEVETLFEQNIAHAQASGDQRAVNLLELHLSILNDCKANGIEAAFEQIEAARQAAEQLTDLPFDVELIPRSIEALTGGPQEKMQHMQYLSAQAAKASDEGTKALINTIQLALFSSSLAGLGQNLEGMYRQAWDTIVAGVEQAGGTVS